MEQSVGWDVGWDEPRSRVQDHGYVWKTSMLPTASKAFAVIGIKQHSQRFSEIIEMKLKR